MLGAPDQRHNHKRRLVSAIYGVSGGDCKKGRPVKRGSKHPEGQYMTPNEFFQKIADATNQLRCYESNRDLSCMPTSLRVRYQQESGLPIKLEDYGALVFDYYWSLEVSDIQSAP